MQRNFDLTSVTGLPVSRVAIWNWYKGGGDLLIFLAFSLATSLFIGQDRVISRGDFMYWMLTVPAVFFPAVRVRQTVHNLIFGRARLIGVFGILATLAMLWRHDFGLILPVVLIVWVAGWACRNEIRINVRHLCGLTVTFYLTGIVLFCLQPPYSDFPWLQAPFKPAEQAEELGAGSGKDVETFIPDQDRAGLNLNAWGILPHQTAPAFGVWRISATPNIATSGLFALLVLLIVLRRFSFQPLKVGTVISSAYFAILSFVRAVFLGLGIFLAAIAIMRVVKSPNLRVAAVLVMTVGVVAVTALSPSILYLLQDWPIVSRMFLRGETGLSVADIYRQAYRPWVWGEHVRLFWESPYLLGQGRDLAESASKSLINAGQARSDSVSFVTRLLATYGIAAFGLIVFIMERCIHHARRDDIWGAAMVAMILFLMMSWGSLFHPTNGIYALAFLILGKGSEGVSDGEAAG